MAAAPPGVRVQSAWIRWLPADLPMAGYATVANDGDTSVQIVKASSTDYAQVSLMRSVPEDGADAMVMIKHLDVPAHGRAAFAPGGYHIMLSKATQPIKPGDRVPITLQFAGGTAVEVTFTVMPADASGPPAH
ncbi:MAG TPA: copper chaperone PCu(A)C [Nevskiaceae bacterium]